MIANPSSTSRVPVTGGQALNNQYSLSPRDSGSQWAYEYDANGNLITQHQSSVADYSGDYTVDEDDLMAFLAADSAQDPSADLNGDGVFNYGDISIFQTAYSVMNGTMLENRHYAYDFRNQLIKATTKFGSTEAISTVNAYDALARRVSETVYANEVLDTSHQLVYGGVSQWEVIEQIDLATDLPMTTHVFGIGIDDEVSYRIEDTGTPEDYWTHRDDLGSLTSITDDSGVVMERYEYGDYGEATILDASGTVLPASSFGAYHLYTGRPMIAGTGLYDYRFRVMDPETGRFVQKDPLGYIDSMNVYTYCSSSPLVRTDPMGLEDRVPWPSGQNKERALCQALQDALDHNMDLKDFLRKYSPTWGTDYEQLRNMEIETPNYGEVDVDWMLTLMFVHYDGIGGERYWLDPLRGADPGDIYDVAKPIWIVWDGATDDDVDIDFGRYGQENEKNAIDAARDVLNGKTTLQELFGIDCSKYSGCGKASVPTASPRPRAPIVNNLYYYP